MKTKKLQFKKAMFTTDAIENNFEGFYIPLESDQELVNSIVPYFPLETGKQIAAILSFDEWEIFYSEVAEVFVSIPRSYGVEFTEISGALETSHGQLFDFDFAIAWQKVCDLD